MPLHDWSDDHGWYGVHLMWIAKLLESIKPRLPGGFTAGVGSVPTLSLESPRVQPDIHTRAWSPPPESRASPGVLTEFEPDGECVVTLSLEPQTAVHILRGSYIVAAVELISPRNKDRDDAKAGSLARYAGYLRQEIHLMLVDVIPRPRNFSFVDQISAEFGLNLPPRPTPHVASFRAGGPAGDGWFLAHKVRPLRFGEPIPTLPLALNVHQAVPIDLESTYMEAVRWALPEMPPLPGQST